MGLLSAPIDAARAGARVAGAVVRLATLPARSATRLGFGVAEAALGLLERGSVVEPRATATPRMRREPSALARRSSGETAPIQAIRPSVARAPAAKRRASTPGIPAEANLSVPAVPSNLDMQAADFNAPATSAPAPARAREQPGVGADAAPEPEAAPDSAPAAEDREATLVAESADAGAAEGAGASVHVEAPWPRYGQMKAADVLDRLPAQEAATLSLLLLYEHSHRARRTVIAAAERELARRSSPAGR